MGGQRHFPRNTVLHYLHTLLHPLPAAEMKARQQKRLNNELRARLKVCGPLLIWKDDLPDSDELFPTVLKSPPHMMLWTKRTFSWEMAEADGAACGPWHTGNVRKKCTCRLLPTIMSKHILLSGVFCSIQPSYCSWYELWFQQAKRRPSTDHCFYYEIMCFFIFTLALYWQMSITHSQSPAGCRQKHKDIQFKVIWNEQKQ